MSSLDSADISRNAFVVFVLSVIIEAMCGLSARWADQHHFCLCLWHDCSFSSEQMIHSQDSAGARVEQLSVFSAAALHILYTYFSLELLFGLHRLLREKLFICCFFTRNIDFLLLKKLWWCSLLQTSCSVLIQWHCYEFELLQINSDLCSFIHSFIQCPTVCKDCVSLPFLSTSSLMVWTWPFQETVLWEWLLQDAAHAALCLCLCVEPQSETRSARLLVLRLGSGSISELPWSQMGRRPVRLHLLCQAAR